MGFASSPATRQALAPYGIRVQGARWRWAPGLKGGTFPPHRHINGQVRSSEFDFEALPGDDVNGESCACAVVPVYRTPDGRLAKPGLTPVFQPPVTAALTMEPLDLSPITELIDSLSERHITVNVPEVRIPDAPNVYVDAPPAPVVNIPEFAAFPDIPAPVVNVAAPEVTVNLPETPHRGTSYFAGESGKVAIPKGHLIVSVSCVCTDKAGSVKIGSNPTIPVPANHTWFDDPDTDPVSAKTVIFRNTVAYTVRTVT